MTDLQGITTETLFGIVFVKEFVGLSFIQIENK